MSGFEVVLSLVAVSALGATVQAHHRLRRLRSGILDCAHEFARPLAALMLSVDRRSPEDRDEVSLAGEVERACLVLADLRGLAATQPSAGGDVFDLGELACEIAGGWAPLAGMRGRSLQVAEGRSVEVGGDRARAGQLITGLVANAIEHGSGTVSLGVSCSGRQAVLEVRDEGIDAGGSAREDREGRGRGLRIARGSARMCGCVLSTEFSRSGSSARLTFTQAGDSR